MIKRFFVILGILSILLFILTVYLEVVQKYEKTLLTSYKTAVLPSFFIA